MAAFRTIFIASLNNTCRPLICLWGVRTHQCLQTSLSLFLIRPFIIKHGDIGQWLAYLRQDPAAQGSIPSNPKLFIGNFDVVKIY